MENNELKLSPFYNDENLWKGKSEWRKAKPGNGLNLSIFRDAIIEKFGPKIEDIDYVDVTDLHSLPELTHEFAIQLLEYNKLHVHDGLFNQPEHIAFLGHPLNSK